MGGTKKGTDPSRAERKAKKRKLEDAIPNIPGDNEIEVEPEILSQSEKPVKKRKRDQADAEEDSIDEQQKKKEKKEKKEKKDKKNKKSDEEGGNAPGGDETEDLPKKSEEANGAVENSDIPKKSKKERKAERKARDAAEAAANGEAKSPAVTSTPGSGAVVVAAAATKEKKPKKNKQNQEKKAPGEKGTANGSGEKTDGKAARFIVFIGSLPYTATKASIQKHFATVKPIAVRSPMQKEDASKSKGYAFLEFEGYDHMKTCLKLFHHSSFDDGISPPRKISVELTAGGGGNTKDRKDKIKAKNDKLNEERVRRIHEEAKAKAAKSGGGTTDESSIHPSRRTLVPMG